VVGNAQHSSDRIDNSTDSTPCSEDAFSDRR
jgi:hypothetical protein